MKKCSMQIKKDYKYITDLYRSDKFIPLHEPVFGENEKKYVNDCIDSTFVSSIGKFVDKFEEDFSKLINCKGTVAVVNGTSALQIALNICGVKAGDEVITQSFNFVATANSIIYNGAIPVVIDVDYQTMGMSPDSLKKF